MSQVSGGIRLPLAHTLLIAVGFPLGSTLLSLLLLHRQVFVGTGLDFFTAFWLLISVWYAVQLLGLQRLLGAAGYSLRDIGYGLTPRQTGLLVAGYGIVALALVGFVEAALAGASVDAARLSDFANISPTTTPQRLVFVVMALLAGLTEELVYRGFLITALREYGLNRWLAVGLAALPFVAQHGLKAASQFGWFFSMGLVLGLLFIWRKQLLANIILHWLIILSALLALLQTLR
jgi:uncharacterized protein